MPLAPSESSKTRIVVQALLARSGRTFAQELGIDVAKNMPRELFKLLVFALLSATRISNKLAMRGTLALFEHGWTTAQDMAAATWRQRTDTLDRSGYARYDESRSRYLGETTALLIEHYGGDLRRLREEAHRDPGRERELLRQFKGIGDVGVDIFFREAQAAWNELYPFADHKALRAADRLELGRDAHTLGLLVPRQDFPRLVAALVRCDLENAYEEFVATST
ncbi:MAG TPA: hypothetical protein VHP11_12785 [Tepidisphaeraceae bacterium]|nr:hypothetical protein [Tepidisphaeraceae bacterium]